MALRRIFILRYPPKAFFEFYILIKKKIICKENEGLESI